MVNHPRSKPASAFLSLLVAGSLAACGGDDNGGTQPATTGSITATVRADGDPLSSVTVQRFETGASSAEATASTGSGGQATFANVEEGSWDVGIVVPTGYSLEDGEDDRKSVTVTAGQTSTVAFDLVDDFEGETVEALDNFTFSQPNLTISAGTAVRWINAGTMLHTVTPDGHAEWSSATLGENGDTFTHTFDTPGTYEYFCQPHEGAGMRGTVTVN